MLEMINTEFNGHIEVAKATADIVTAPLIELSKLCTSALDNGGKILICGNGGSAADAQHIAAELVGRYKIERKGLAAIALTTDSSIITAIGNDYGYHRVFDRQVEALAVSGDVLIGISTSGNSTNVVNALQLAKKIGCSTVGMTGGGGGRFIEVCDVSLVVPSFDVPRIQEMHIVIGHTLCQLIEQHCAQM